MYTVSTKTRTFVKHKSQENRHFSTHQSSQLNKPAAALRECRQSGQDRQDSDPGADDGFVLEFDIGIIDAKHEHRGISLTARYILGIIEAYLRAHPRGYLSEDKIAQAAGCCRSTVSRAEKQLKEAGLLGVDDSDKCNRYRVCEWVEHLPKIWVNPALVRDDDLSILQAGFVSYVKFRQGNNLATWLKIREAAEALGVSYHSVARAAASDAVLDFVEKIHRPERRSSKNEYYLTEVSWLETFVFGPKSARPKCSALGQTSRKKELFNAPFGRRAVFSPDFGLSNDSKRDQEVYRLLRSIGTADSVARPMAFEQRYPLADVEQAIVNAALRGDDYHRRIRRSGLRARRFNLAGYVIAILNGAHRECHGVGPSKLAEVAQARAPAGARAAAGGRLPEAEFEQRRQEQLRALKVPPAKLITPYTDAEMALIASKRDKEAEDQILHQAQADGSRRYFRGHKWANSAKKADFSLDKAG